MRLNQVLRISLAVGIPSILVFMSVLLSVNKATAQLTIKGPNDPLAYRVEYLDNLDDKITMACDQPTRCNPKDSDDTKTSIYIEATAAEAPKIPASDFPYKVGNQRLVLSSHNEKFSENYAQRYGQSEYSESADYNTDTNMTSFEEKYKGLFPSEKHGKIEGLSPLYINKSQSSALSGSMIGSDHSSNYLERIDSTDEFGSGIEKDYKIDIKDRTGIVVRGAPYTKYNIDVTMTARLWMLDNGTRTTGVQGSDEIQTYEDASFDPTTIVYSPGHEEIPCGFLDIGGVSLSGGMLGDNNCHAQIQITTGAEMNGNGYGFADVTPQVNMRLAYAIYVSDPVPVGTVPPPGTEPSASPCVEPSPTPTDASPSVSPSADTASLPQCDSTPPSDSPSPAPTDIANTSRGSYLVIPNDLLNLPYGSTKTADVASLQGYLYFTGYITSDNVTGVYGQVTRAAVARYKADHAPMDVQTRSVNPSAATSTPPTASSTPPTATSTPPTSTSTPPVASSTPSNSPIVSLVVLPNTPIYSGQSVKLSWSSLNTTSCAGTETGGNMPPGWNGSMKTSGTIFTGPIYSSTVYSIACKGDNGLVGRSVSVKLVSASGGGGGSVQQPVPSESATPSPSPSDSPSPSSSPSDESPSVSPDSSPSASLDFSSYSFMASIWGAFLGIFK